MSETTETNHSDRIGRATAVAREYDALLGLGYLSLGLGMVVGATMPGMAPIWIALGAAFWAMSAGWCHRHYGFVRARRDRASRLALGAVTAVLIIVLGQIADRLVNSSLISITLLCVAVVLAVGQRLSLRRVGLTPVHIVVYLVVAAAALIPIFFTSFPFWVSGGFLSPYVLTVTGAACIIIGITDHLRLTRLMAPLSTDEATSDLQ